MLTVATILLQAWLFILVNLQAKNSYFTDIAIFHEHLRLLLHSGGKNLFEIQDLTGVSLVTLVLFLTKNG